MRRLRAEHAQSFAKTRTSGHLLGALAQEEGAPLETAPTAHISDYPAANKFQLEVNKDALQNGKSKELERWDRWKGELGVAAFNARNEYSPDGVVLLQVSAVMGEFNSCFRDGVFTMAADKQFSEAAKKIKGGWLSPYKNVLFYDELEQKKSVVAISDVHTFSMHCPFTYDVVDAVHHVLQAKVPKYQGVQLQPVELTFFLGVTAASCTTNCLAPVVKVIHEGIGIRHGSITTIHDVTNTQTIVDRPAKDLRRARSALNSLIPTTTGSATAITLIYPELTGRLNGHAVRVPLLNASLTDCVFEVARDTTEDEVNALFKTAAEGPLAGILGYEERPLVSADYTNDTRSSIVDAPSTMVVNGTQVKIYAWYDNEMGYAHRLVDVALMVGAAP